MCTLGHSNAALRYSTAWQQRSSCHSFDLDCGFKLDPAIDTVGSKFRVVQSPASIVVSGPQLAPFESSPPPSK